MGPTSTIPRLEGNPGEPPTRCKEVLEAANRRRTTLSALTMRCPCERCFAQVVRTEEGPPCRAVFSVRYSAVHLFPAARRRAKRVKRCSFPTNRERHTETAII